MASGGNSSDEPSAKPTTSATPTEKPSDESSTCKPYRAVGDFLHKQGFEKSDFISWYPSTTHVIDWQLALNRSVADPLSLKPLRSEAALTRFLDGDGVRSTLAHGLLQDDYGDEESEWLAVQFQLPINYSGNWYFTDRKVVKGGDEMALGGDVWWFNVDSSTCEVVQPNTVRAICGNVGLDDIEPAVLRE